MQKQKQIRKTGTFDGDRHAKFSQQFFSFSNKCLAFSAWKIQIKGIVFMPKKN